MERLMSDNDWFTFKPEQAQAYGRIQGNEFLVRKGSTAMREGSSKLKRDREERNRLIRIGVLVPDDQVALYRFSRDHLFNSSSAAGGVIRDGNCSGPQSWRRVTDGKTLKQVHG